MDPDTIATLLPRVGTAEAVAIDLLRYVPMRRALLRISADGQDYYAKSFSRAEHHRQSTEALELVRGLPVRVPHLLVSAPELNTVIMDHVTGSPLSEFLVDGPLQPLLETGRALATVHRSCLVPGKTRSPIDELKDVEDLLAIDLAPALPKLASRVIDLVGRLKHQLTQLGELEPVPIHGKLFGDQVLYDPAAQDSIAIVDWDDLTGGDPHFDLGRLVAHILFDSQMGARFNPRTRVAALLEGYERAGGKWDHERLRWHVAVALLLRGKISLLRCLAADWEASLETIVIEAESMLAGRSLETGITLVGARRS